MTLPLHQIADHLGSSARGLQYLYAINGCDTVSSFRGIGKRTAFHISKHFEFLAQLSNVNYSCSVYCVHLLEKNIKFYKIPHILLFLPSNIYIRYCIGFPLLVT